MTFIAALSVLEGKGKPDLLSHHTDPVRRWLSDPCHSADCGQNGVTIAYFMAPGLRFEFCTPIGKAISRVFGVIAVKVDKSAGNDKPGQLFVKYAHFVWPGGEGDQRIDGVGCVMSKVRRANGSLGLSAKPLPGEKEVDRFMAHYLRMVATAGADGRLADRPVSDAVFRLGCEGGGELLLTDKRLLTTVILGGTVFGDVNEQHGRVMVIDIPYSAITSVDILRKKAIFGGMKVKAVRVWSMSMPTALDLEPVARLAPDAVSAVKTPYQVFADSLVAAACAHALANPGITAVERQRLTDLRAGSRVIENGDVIAMIADPEPR